MTFVEGFLTPVPTANKDAYIKHATGAIGLFKSLGATRFVESWGDDVPDGKLNDLKKAVKLEDGETVLFSWVEYPDKAARDAANAKMMADPNAMEMMKNMPFDAKRMIYAGFDVIAETGDAQAKPGYVDGIVLAVPSDNKQAYRAMAEKMGALFHEYGARRIVDSWGEDVPDGETTDYNRATHKQDGETVVYSWIEWPDKDTRNTAWDKIMQDERARPDGESPFDGKRMMWGGFAPILDETLA
jgi:uncharacterized protein YbaA (DUF1428 family)